jgi:hypothetical protein
VDLNGQGKWDDALRAAEQALAIRQSILGERHRDLASSLNNLGFLETPNERRGADCYAIVLLSRSGDGQPLIRVVFLGEAEDIEEDLQRWRNQVQNNSLHEGIEIALRKKVWDPLAAALPRGTRQLIVAPDGESRPPPLRGHPP